MKWIKDIFADVKVAVLAPITNILCLAGVLLLFASFVDYDKAQGVSLHGNVHWIMTIAGLSLVIVGLVIFYTQRTTSIPNKIDYDKGVELKRDNLKINIKSGDIQTISNTTRNSAIVLPANTTFVDDCATDVRTAMGAFFTTRFPEEIGQLSSTVKDALDTAGIQVQANGQYAAGTTIMLPDRFAKPAKIVVTASTIRIHGKGILSNPQIICNCIEKILIATANQRIDTIYLPILGSGHGGIDCGLALMFLLLAIFHFSKTYHHIKVVHIVVHPKDIDGLNHSKELSQVLAMP